MYNEACQSEQRQLIALIIDGEERMRHFLKKHLSSLGFTCFCADDYATALQAVINGRIIPDIILVSDNQEALRHADTIIKACVNHTCLVLSYASPQECNDTYPGIVHLRRPLMISELHEAVNNLMSRKTLCQL